MILREVHSPIQPGVRWRGTVALAALVWSLAPAFADPPPPPQGAPPEAVLYHPGEDHNRPGALLMTWKTWCDCDVAIRSVSLHWAVRVDGPWRTIGDPTKMVKTDRYWWQVPASVPPRVYLRLTVCDTAGRTAAAQTREALPLFLLPRKRPR